MTRKQIAKKIIAYRNAQIPRLSQSALSRIVDVTPQMVNQIESCKKGIGRKTATPLAKLLGCEPGDLVVWGKPNGQKRAAKTAEATDGAGRVA
jgi:DNA-binding XRE family transcriptional regulator